MKEIQKRYNGKFNQEDIVIDDDIKDVVDGTNRECLAALEEQVQKCDTRLTQSLEWLTKLKQPALDSE